MANSRRVLGFKRHLNECRNEEVRSQRVFYRHQVT